MTNSHVAGNAKANHTRDEDEFRFSWKPLSNFLNILTQPSPDQFEPIFPLPFQPRSVMRQVQPQLDPPSAAFCSTAGTKSSLFETASLPPTIQFPAEEDITTVNSLACLPPPAKPPLLPSSLLPPPSGTAFPVATDALRHLCMPTNRLISSISTSSSTSSSSFSSASLSPKSSPPLVSPGFPFVPLQPNRLATLAHSEPTLAPSCDSAPPVAMRMDISHNQPVFPSTCLPLAFHFQPPSSTISSTSCPVSSSLTGSHLSGQSQTAHQLTSYTPTTGHFAHLPYPYGPDFSLFGHFAPPLSSPPETGPPRPSLFHKTFPTYCPPVSSYSLKSLGQSLPTESTSSGQQHLPPSHHHPPTQHIHLHHTSQPHHWTREMDIQTSTALFHNHNHNHTHPHLHVHSHSHAQLNTLTQTPFAHIHLPNPPRSHPQPLPLSLQMALPSQLTQASLTHSQPPPPPPAPAPPAPPAPSGLIHAFQQGQLGSTPHQGLGLQRNLSTCGLPAAAGFLGHTCLTTGAMTGANLAAGPLVGGHKRNRKRRGMLHEAMGRYFSVCVVINIGSKNNTKTYFITNRV
ncbi:unnamed protein product [Protopolystoma xenopodis]|uniref:Uncharacterized protein n=1 Tax=Protopolystoma xenopodis TaxID=117903 RepID=A0A448WTI8_9PLAT|nr:unnamed protein product [Protopolystoma xenopodis]